MFCVGLSGYLAPLFKTGREREWSVAKWGVGAAVTVKASNFIKKG
jgi:hypothetical protein